MWILICHDCTAKHPTLYKLPAFYRPSLFEDKGIFSGDVAFEGWRFQVIMHQRIFFVVMHLTIAWFGIGMLYVSHHRVEKTCLKKWIQPPSCRLIQAGLNPGKSCETFTRASCNCCQSLFVLSFTSFPTSTTESVALAACRLKEQNRLELPSWKKTKNKKRWW